ncbi:MAG: hypothetical protein ACHQX1_00755 [Candidatus Micrarchaeales archaeon]
MFSLTPESKKYAIACVTVALMAVLYLAFFTNTPSPTTKTSTTVPYQYHNVSYACAGIDANVAVPNGPHGIYVFAPLDNQGAAAVSLYNQDVQSYFLTSNIICGVTLGVDWASIDNGNGNYNFSALDKEVALWTDAGKIVNFDLKSSIYAKVITPQYVLSSSNVIYCNATIPVYWQQPFISDYQAFMKAFVQHYQNTRGIGYIRFGLGISGESTPIRTTNWNQNCSAQFSTYGFNDTVWENYLYLMMDYEKTLMPKYFSMIAIKAPPDAVNNFTYFNAISAHAVSDSISIGSQGFQISDGNGEHCSNGWCNIFMQNLGKVPFELQTLLKTCPDNSCQTGSLVNLMPIALSNNTQVLEIYWQDFDIIYNPTNPNYTQYHSIYQSTLQNASYIIN